MANAKQYNDLNTTSTVNSADKVALAQADKTELVTTTVSDLASAVGELNQAGALAELSLATSMGKNLLAQRLNEKGATDITPENTLIEMADAVDGLQTNNDSNIVSGYVSNIGSAGDNNLVGISCANWFVIGRAPNGRTVFVLDGVIYLLSSTRYANLGEAVNNAIGHADMHGIENISKWSGTRSRPNMGFSEGSNTLILESDFDSSANTRTMALYSIDWETGEISYIQEVVITVSSADSSSYCSVATDNSRTFLVYTYYANSDGKVVRLSDGLASGTFNIPNSSSGDRKHYFFSPTNNNIFYAVSYDRYLYQYSISADTSTITVTGPTQIFQNGQTASQLYYSGTLKKIVAKSIYKSIAVFGPTWKMIETIIICDLDGANATEYDIRYGSQAWNYNYDYARPTSNIIDDLRQHSFAYASWVQDETNENLYHIHAPIYEQLGIAYNKETNTLIADTKESATLSNYWYVNYSHGRSSVFLELTNSNYLTHYNNNSGEGPALPYFGGNNNVLQNTNSTRWPEYMSAEMVLPKRIVLTVLRTINGQETQGDIVLCHTKEGYNSGAYDLTTKQVEIK